jgi:hypothetical protein
MRPKPITIAEVEYTAFRYPHFAPGQNVLEWILLVRRKTAFRCEAGTRFFVFNKG